MSKYQPLEGMVYYNSYRREMITVFRIIGDQVHFYTNETTDGRSWMTSEFFEDYCYTLHELGDVLSEYRSMKDRHSDV
jgi:hypothetical protein